MIMDPNDPRREPKVDNAFSKRVKIACDNHPLVPGMREGRLVWIQTEFKRQGMDLSLQTIQRWYHGVARPRPKKLSLLASILRVDDSWLAHGRSIELDALDMKKRVLNMEGMVNIVAGYVQLAGWQVALPDDTDRQDAHFFSIIQGKKHAFHVARGVVTKDQVKAHLPPSHEGLTVIIGVEREELHSAFFHVPSAVIAKHGKAMGGFVDFSARLGSDALTVKTSTVPQVASFATSLKD